MISHAGIFEIRLHERSAVGWTKPSATTAPGMLLAPLGFLFLEQSDEQQLELVKEGSDGSFGNYPISTLVSAAEEVDEQQK